MSGEQKEKGKAFQAGQGNRMSQDTEAKIHIGGYSKIKERILRDYGDGMRLNWSCEGWGLVRNMIRGEKRKPEVTQGL